LTDDTSAKPAEETTARKKWDPNTDPDGYTWDDISPKDWYLDTVLNFVLGFSDEYEGGSVGLTVQSNGVTVSGMAISRTEWIAGIVGQYAQAGAEDTGKYIKQLFEQANAQAIDGDKERQKAELPTTARRFLHLKDARIGHGDQYTQVPLWRGKLSDITGWSLGSWNPPRASEVSTEEWGVQ
jgi:hypothetical protein